MKTIHVNTATAKQELSKLINLVFYGEKRVVVTSHGKPKVQIITIRDEEDEKQKRLQALQKADRLRKHIKQSMKKNLPDPVTMLHEARQERDKQLQKGLR